MKILFAADTSFSFMDFPGKGSAERIFADVRKLFEKFDYSFINLENIFGDKNDYVPIVKGGPNLISPYDFAEYIDTLQPSGIGLANNHARDFGPEPMLKTKEFLSPRAIKL